MEHYFEYLKSMKRSQHTISSYRNALDKFIVFLSEQHKFILPKDAAQVSRKIIREYLIKLDKDGKSCNTRNQSLYAIKSYFSWLCNDECSIETDPSQKISSVKVSYRITKSCSLEEVKTLFSYIKERNGIRNKAILAIFVTCGLRCEEMVNLNLQSLFNENGLDFLRIIGKGDKERIVVLSPTCSEHLKNYLKERIMIVTDSEAMFLSEKTKQRMGTHAIYDLVCEIRDRCGIHLYPHKLRHTAGTHMYNATKDIVAVQENLGHAAISTTRRYIHAPTIQSQNAVMNNPLNEVL